MNRTSLTWAANTSLVLVGLVANVIGPVMPSVIEYYGLSLATAGVVFTVLGLGRLIAVFSTSSWSDRVGRKPVMRLGGILTVIGAIGYGISPIWFGNILSAAVLGAGTGLLDGASNALISDLYTEKRSLALNRLHVFFGIGSLIGPLVAAFFLGILHSWRLLFAVIAALSGVHAIFALRQTYPEVDIGDNNGRELLAQGKRAIVSSPEFWLLSGIVFTYSGIGGIIIGWVNTYLAEELTLTILAASLVLALYNVGITLGRLIWGGISEQIGCSRTLLVCSIGGMVFVTLAVFGRQLWWIAVTFCLTGVFLAGLFPIALASGTGLFSQWTGTVSGYLMTASSLGSIMLPFLVGVVSDTVGLGFGMLGASFFGIIQLALAASLQRRQVAKTEVEIGA